MNNRLPILAENARTAHSKAIELGIASAQAALVAGKALSEAKHAVPHGSWLDWLRETRIPERTAQRYIALLRGGCESAMVADLGQERCARLSTLGLKLWPEPGVAVMQTCQEDQATCLAVWCRPDAEASTRYGLARMHAGTKAKDWCGVYPPVPTPFALGAIHDHWMGRAGKRRPLPLEDATGMLDDWEGLSA